MRLLPAAVAVLVLVACASNDSAAPSTAHGGAPPERTSPGDETVCAEASLEQRAATVLIIGLPGVTGADDPLVDRLAGSGIGGVMLREENLLELAQAQALVSGLRSRLGADLLVAIDEEGGRVTALDALGDETPSARRLGRAGPDEAARAGRALGERLRTIGIDWVFGPVVDLDDGPAGGLIGDRSFGADPAGVAASAGAFAAGMHETGVAVTLKHFPGAIGQGDPHVGASTSDVTMAELKDTSLVPFQALISQGAEGVMVGHVTYPRLWGAMPASLEPAAYDLLRSLDFEGLALTDALGMGTVYNRWGFDAAPAMAIAAGADATLVNQGDRFQELIDGIVGAVERGDLSQTRLDSAARRVLDVHGDGDRVICSELGERERPDG